MSQHAFNTGDIVKPSDERGGHGHLEVVGESEHYPGMVICRPDVGGSSRCRPGTCKICDAMQPGEEPTTGRIAVSMPYRPENLTLVLAAGESKS